MKYKRMCLLDTETTDVYWNSCVPVQIAALIIDGDGNILSTFNERCRSNRHISPDASTVHGIYDEDLVGCRHEKDVLFDFCAWMKGWDVDCIVTYNGNSFDRPMLNERCKKYDFAFPYFQVDNFPGIDMREDVFYARKNDLFGLKALGRKWKLTLVSDILGFDTSGAHDALADVRMLRDVLLKLDPVIHPENWQGENNTIQGSLF